MIQCKAKHVAVNFVVSRPCSWLSINEANRIFTRPRNLASNLAPWIRRLFDFRSLLEPGVYCCTYLLLCKAYILVFIPELSLLYLGCKFLELLVGVIYESTKETMSSRGWLLALNQMVSNAKEIVHWARVNVVSGMLRLDELVDYWRIILQSSDIKRS